MGEIPPIDDDGRTPLLVCLNHSSWWDPLIGLLAAADQIGWEWYGVMDERQLQRYRFFTKLGMIGVDRTSLPGAKQFLDYVETLLKHQRRALWMTPQGAMLSNHARPIRFQPGIGHLASRLGAFHLLLMTVHYEFWNERQPEVFLSFSPVTRMEVSAAFDRRAFVGELETRMECQLDRLLAVVERRDPQSLVAILRGKSGISTTYDAMRATGARLRGEGFSAEHGEVITPAWKSAVSESSKPSSRSDRQP